MMDKRTDGRTDKCKFVCRKKKVKYKKEGMDYTNITVRFAIHRNDMEEHFSCTSHPDIHQKPFILKYF